MNSNAEQTAPTETPPSITAAFTVKMFRRIWAASLFTNLGMFIQMVGSGWAMTQLSASPALVPLVQTALWGPTMLLAMPAGAIADTYDRRKVAIIASCLALAGASALATSSCLRLFNPYVLLSCCAVIGTGSALMGPAWQASVIEQVPRALLPSAIALTSIASNLARSFGPALGGAVVAAGGPFSAFVINVVCYVPALVVLILWKRAGIEKGDRENLVRSISSGMRYITGAASLRSLIARGFIVSLPGGSVTALMPLVSKNLLHGNAGTFGLVLGAFGLGSVFGAFNLGRMLHWFETETLMRICAVGAGAGVLIEALVPSLPIVLPALFVAGGFWVINFSVFNIELQLSAPEKVVGRALAALQAATSGGGAIGAALWGLWARGFGVEQAVAGSGVCMIACAFLGVWFRMTTANPHAPAEG